MGLAKRSRRAARRHPRRRRPPRPESSDSDTFMSTLFSSSSSSDNFPSDDSGDDRRHRDRVTLNGARHDDNVRNGQHDQPPKSVDVAPPPMAAASVHRADAHVDEPGRDTPHAPVAPPQPHHVSEVAMRDSATLHVPSVASSAAAAVLGGAAIQVPLGATVSAYAAVPTVAQPHPDSIAVAMAPPPLAPLLLPPGPRPAFTILRQATLAATREYAALPTVRPWRELARAADPTGRMALDTHTVWCSDDDDDAADGALLTLPARFDGRRRWGRLLTPPGDQGLSGACWAYAVVSALGDRAALWTHGAVRPWSDGIPRPRVFGGLSARDLIDRDFDALTDAQSEGEAAVVAANQAHHGTRHADYGHTLAGALETLYVDGVAGQGGWRCRPLAYYGLAAATQADIKAEIFAWGPVASAFALYEDFMYPARYPSSWIGGVYRHDPEACRQVFGGHAVVLVGWCEAWLPDRHPRPSMRALSTAVASDRHPHHPPHQALHGPYPQRHTAESPVYLSATAEHSTSKHTCWIARHAWGPTWSGAAVHGDGHFVMVANQCHIEANVVACVPDIHGMSLDPRDAHRVAPPSASARARRATSGFRPSADLLGPDRIDPALLPDMCAFVAGEVHMPDDNPGARHYHDNGTEYAGGHRPPSDAWTTALRRAWTPLGREHPHAVAVLKEAPGDDGQDANNSTHAHATDARDPDMLSETLSSHMPVGYHYRGEEDAAPFGASEHVTYDPHSGQRRAGDSISFALHQVHGRHGVADNAGRRHEDVYHSNSDAELSDDERRLDAHHRVLRQGQRRRTQPRAWADATHHQDAW
ncbi:Papain-like cysteine peptidase [Pandoravirus neocaledonia]|uniref:Papain-like cysteine peptidase n=1 Tax=Pandoravirus neocaledonia TaxID=2107708 RepID=A0A2U7UCJ3_9VIRU|nr:Papain-like cysteine peptidase [Pandoravirus neocaledonia]AVK76189.1 Papain-like cysteine peptidase [Pandoravirus neocaledonia]